MLSAALSAILAGVCTILWSTWRELNNAFRYLLQQEERHRTVVDQMRKDHTEILDRMRDAFSNEMQRDMEKTREAFNHLRSSSLEAKAAVDVAQSKAGLELELLKESMRQAEPHVLPPEEAPGTIITKDGVRLEPVDILDLI